MEINSKELNLRGGSSNFYLAKFRRNHIISFSCCGYLSHKRNLIKFSEGEIIFLPKNEIIRVFVFGELSSNLKIRLYKCRGAFHNDFFSDISSYLKAMSLIKSNDDYIPKALDFYISHVVQKRILDGAKDSKFKAKLRNVVLSNVTEKWTYSRLGAVLYMSQSTLYRALRKEGILLIDFVDDIRLEYSRGLLKRTNLAIGEVCYNSGFNSGSYFSKKFRAKYGMTPSEYRKSRL
ncbi:helix-turn-helix transcriptional regulator [Vibrio sp. SM6]|uniref:Helix-turn-helix transcriptional regulator n=1 Tax=Vibrio agarilyticus TaxID=2726741 RepID=A0A7X8TRU2_9VIBR|nr:AraC family transcriptional regulator [Vibrio agarilyticus]NLS13609.1 helix-turn-helix transcriptional regulator [Vibrio agarilyticus]